MPEELHPASVRCFQAKNSREMEHLRGRFFAPLEV
jgi:hypothetical protein